MTGISIIPYPRNTSDLSVKRILHQYPVYVRISVNKFFNEAVYAGEATAR